MAKPVDTPVAYIRGSAAAVLGINCLSQDTAACLLVDGRLAIESAPGQGTRVIAWVPRRASGNGGSSA